MNDGLFGFLLQANATLDIQFFEPAGAYIWYKPKNAKICLIDGTGGGGGGSGAAANGTSSVIGSAGIAGTPYELILNAEDLNDQEIVTIGVGGTGAAGVTGTLTPNPGGNGGDTTFAGYVWGGGVLNVNRNAFIGAAMGNYFGQSATAAAPQGLCGGFGSGGGGAGANHVGNTGQKYGGRPRYFRFTVGGTNAQSTRLGSPPTERNSPDGLGGIPGNIAGGGAGTAGQNGDNASRTVDGYGEGGAGGGRMGNSSLVGGNGGNGIRGSGGGSSGSSINFPGNGGRGGDGFLRIVTYCWP